MDESAAKVFVSVVATKLLLGRLFALMYVQLKLNPDHVPAMHKTILEKWSAEPLIKSSDPTISDVMSDEVLREMETFLQGVEKDFRRMCQYSQ